MSERDLRVELERRWRELEQHDVPPTGELLTVDLPADEAGRVLLLALGSDGRRMLVPLSRGHEHRLREDRRSAAVQLVRRPIEDPQGVRWFAELVCLRGELQGVFTALCSDVVQRLEVAEQAPAAAVLTDALDQWRALFAGSGRLLSAQRLAGLYGELVVLNLLLGHSADAASAWQGPTGAIHDFAWTGHAVEVKTTLSPDGRNVRVHGLDQLETPPDSRLLLAFHRVETVAAGGRSVPELVEQACVTGDQGQILGKLALAGYSTADAEHYRRIEFLSAEELWFEVDDGIPRLTHASLVNLPEGVSAVHYTSDLSKATPIATAEPIQAFLQTLSEARA